MRAILFSLLLAPAACVGSDPPASVDAGPAPAWDVRPASGFVSLPGCPGDAGGRIAVSADGRTLGALELWVAAPCWLPDGSRVEALLAHVGTQCTGWGGCDLLLDYDLVDVAGRWTPRTQRILAQIELEPSVPAVSWHGEAGELGRVDLGAWGTP